MWKDRDIRDLFEEYSSTPPIEVWENISSKIAVTSNQKRPYFNSAQKMTLIAACLCSIFLYGFMLQFIESSTTSSSKRPILFTKVKRDQETTTPKDIILIRSLTTDYRSTIDQHKGYVNTDQSHHKKAKLNTIAYNDQYKNLRTKIIELAKVDKEIEKINREIEALNSQLLYQVADVVNPMEVHSGHIINNKIQAKETYHLTAASSQVRSIIPSPGMDMNYSVAVVEFPTFEKDNNKNRSLYKLYIQPSFGINMSKIFYWGSPNSEYFSENADFGSKIGYNVGTRIGYKFSKRWGIESGVSYGQYIQSFQERQNQINRSGEMYIDQLDIPLLVGYTVPFINKKLPVELSFKAGLLFSNVILYQVNFADNLIVSQTKSYYNYNVDKRQFNTAQLGYAAGFDIDAFLSKRISMNLSILNSMVSQVVNFPTFRGDRRRPIQFSSTFSIGTKVRF